MHIWGLYAFKSSLNKASHVSLLSYWRTCINLRTSNPPSRNAERFELWFHQFRSAVEEWASACKKNFLYVATMDVFLTTRSSSGPLTIHKQRSLYFTKQLIRIRLFYAIFFHEPTQKLVQTLQQESTEYLIPVTLIS